MKLVIPSQLIPRLKAELRRGGRSEIGGVLVGEHIGTDFFRLVDFSVQYSGGTRAHFVRDVAHNQAFLNSFFEKTGHDYQRFNYIGEWHSHPQFQVTPSVEDIATMRDIIFDPNVGVNFAILLITRLNKSRIELSATLFTAENQPNLLTLEIEKPISDRGFLAKFKQLFCLEK